MAAFRQALHRRASLKDLADGNIAAVAFLKAIGGKMCLPDEGALPGWMDRVMAAFERSKWLAGEMLASGRTAHSVRT